MWGGAMSHEMHELKIQLYTPEKHSRLWNKFTISVAGICCFSESQKATCVCLRLVYSCNCRVESKVVLKAGTWLYIDDLFATIIGKVSNLQRFRLLRNSIFILTRNSCIPPLRM